MRRRQPRTMTLPYREVLHDFDNDGYLDVPEVRPLDLGVITTLPMPSQEKARIRRRRRQPFGFQA